MKASHDTYVTKKGVRVRLINNDVLVKTDPLPEMSASGLILYPNGAMEHVANTGTIVAFGYERFETTEGKYVCRPIPELEVGLKCLFVRFLAEQHSNIQVRARIEEGLIRLKPSDIMLVFSEKDLPRFQ